MSSKSSRILEGDAINTDITAPAAIIALALIYIRSNSADILDRMAIPTTTILLDSIKPDILIYKALGRSLVMWHLVEPTEEWIASQIPLAITTALFPSPPPPKAATGGAGSTEGVGGIEGKNTSNPSTGTKSRLYKAPGLEARSALPLYFFAVAGYCYGIGLVYAGTLDPRAKHTLLSKLRMFQSVRDNKPNLDLPASMKGLSGSDKGIKHHVELCVCLVSLSLSCGKLECENVYTIHHISYTIHYTPYTIHHTPYTIHYTPYTIHHTLYTIHYTPYTIHYTLYTIGTRRFQKSKNTLLCTRN